MRSFFTWICDEVFSSGLSANYLTLFVTIIACITSFLSLFLYKSVQIERLEKEQAQAQIVTLEKTVSILHRAKDADNAIAQHILTKNALWDDLNIKTALAIAEIPKDEHRGHNRSATYPKNASDTPNTAESLAKKRLLNARDSAYEGSSTQIKSNDRSSQTMLHNDTLKSPLQPSLNTRKNTYEGRNPLSHEHANNNRIACSIAQKSPHNETTPIDTPLPRLSAPLVMLYKEVSRAHNATTPSMAYGDSSPSRSASQGDDRPTIGTVGKGASYHLR